MKYLPIYQSILKANDKYSFTKYSSNNRKYRFNKHHSIKLNINHVELHYKFLKKEYIFRRIFMKYFHNDIEINWDK